ncbi:MAG: SH3 domain-containing protein [Anaerolineae bacterium]|nr:SH3 domain-containing protein [Anaerolineae bacterium]
MRRKKTSLSHFRYLILIVVLVISILPLLSLDPPATLAVQVTQSLGDDIRLQRQTPTVEALLTQTPVALVTPSSGAVVLLNPFSGPSDSPITVMGQRWKPDSRVIVYLPYQGQEFAVASTLVTPDGSFTVSFFLPLFLTDQALVPIIARTIKDNETAQAFYTIREAIIAPTATALLSAPGGVVTTNSLNVRSGPGIEYGTVGLIQRGQDVTITGRSGGWWRIAYPHSGGSSGWVSAFFIDAQNVEAVPFIGGPPTSVPTPSNTAIPAPTQASYQCSPGQWSGCGGASCPAAHVAQCGSDGQWGQCVWDPGYCFHSTDDDDNEDEDNSDDDDDDDDDSVY